MCAEKWKSEKKDEFISNIDTQRLNNLIHNITENTNIDINNVTKELSEIMLTSALNIFPKPKQNKKESQSQNTITVVHKEKDNMCKQLKRDHVQVKCKYRKSKKKDDYVDLVQKSKCYKKKIKYNSNEWR